MMIHDVFDDVEAETDLGRAVFPFSSSRLLTEVSGGKQRLEPADRRYIRRDKSCLLWKKGSV